MVKKTIIILSLGALAIAAFMFSPHAANAPQQPHAELMRVNGVSVSVEVARTSRDQALGLSGRESLGREAGMLFVYDDAAIRNFWMKGMRFPLDVIWIADNVVVGTQEHIPFASGDGSMVRFQSSKPADMVLEVHAGWVAEHGIQPGNTAVLDIYSD